MALVARGGRDCFEETGRQGNGWVSSPCWILASAPVCHRIAKNFLWEKTFADEQGHIINVVKYPQ